MRLANKSDGGWRDVLKQVAQLNITLDNKRLLEIPKSKIDLVQE